MNRRTLGNGLLFALNLTVGTVVVTALVDGLLRREGEVDEMRAAARQERRATAELEREVGVQEALLEGLRNDDPYVIELLARDKLDFRGADEVLPPPLPDR